MNHPSDSDHPLQKDSAQVYAPETCLPKWETADLPEPTPPSWRNWKALIGPGIVMMGIQIGGGEWLVGPEVTAKYGGGLMWIATIAILVQVFYNMECGRYALYCGEPIMTGFLRSRPGPRFWVGVFLLLSVSALIPGLSTQAASIIASLIRDRPVGEEDRALVMGLAYACYLLIVLPVLVGGKIYNMLQTVMTVKIVIVLGFCLVAGVLWVDPIHWWEVVRGFLGFGNVPVSDGQGGELVVNAFSHYATEGHWPIIAIANIAVLGAFAGYAGGGGISNSTYSNYVRDKGWGMGAQVGAIPSAIGGREVKLSHLGKVFTLTADNLRRWKGWWKYIVVDQVFIWAPGCFVGMALPALLSLQFAQHSPVFKEKAQWEKARAAAQQPAPANLNATNAAPTSAKPAVAGDPYKWAQPMIMADGMRHAPQFSPRTQQWLWLIVSLVGLVVLLPSQMSIAEDVSRRWTDVIWSANPRVRDSMHGNQVSRIYYTILGGYVVWCLFALYIFSHWGNPKLMIMLIANLGNLTLGFTAFYILRINMRLLPPALRPRWYHRAGIIACGIFYLGLAVLVFFQTQWPFIKGLFN